MNSSKPLLLLCLLGPLASASGATIKFATLAPEGTDAMKLMHAIDADIRAKTNGALEFKFYAGGRQGDEKDIVRKIRLGQLQGGGFTGVGLGEIAPQVRILDAPWLFRNHEEVDFVYKTFAKDFEKALESAGYVLLGWTEVGFVHIFSNSPVHSAADMRKLKIWVWEGDPIAEAAFSALRIHPIPLSITDVNTSLATGLIDTVYSAPLYAIALQWHEKTKYVYSLPLANASGAVLLSKKFYDGLSPKDRKLLMDICRKHLGKLNAMTREENRQALETLKKQGLQITFSQSPQDAEIFEEAGRKARRDLVGRLYSQDFLERVEKSLLDFRSKHAGGKS